MRDSVCRDNALSDHERRRSGRIGVAFSGTPFFFGTLCPSQPLHFSVTSSVSLQSAALDHLCLWFQKSKATAKYLVTPVEHAIAC